MKRLCKIIAFIQVLLITFTLINFLQINAFASSSINYGNRKVANVAVLLHNFQDPYMLEIRKSLEDIQKENQDKVNFTFYDGKDNIAEQNATIDALLKSDIDLFILDLIDTSENSVRNVIASTKARSLPVIFIEIPQDVVLKVYPSYNRAVFLYSTSSGEGKLQGKILVDKWNADKKLMDSNRDNILQYVLLKGEPDNPYAIERSKDAISAIKEAGIETEQLAEINANWLRDLARSTMENIFLRYDGKIEAIIANNDAMAIGAVEALQKYGYNKGDKNKNIVVVGIDGLKEAIDLIDSGAMTGTLIQDTRMVAEAVYNVGMNLTNSKSPIENTSYQLKEGSIIIPESYQEYTGKPSIP